MKKCSFSCALVAVLTALSAFMVVEGTQAGECGVMVTSTATFMPTATPKLAPDVAFLAENGHERHLNEFRGRPLVVNFWGTWCAPCVKEVPSMNRFIGDMAKTDLEVLALAWEKKGGLAEVGAFFQRLQASRMVPRLDEGGRAAKAFGIRQFPSTVLIGRDGGWIGTLVGGLDWDQVGARTWVQNCLEPTSR